MDNKPLNVRNAFTGVFRIRQSEDQNFLTKFVTRSWLSMHEYNTYILWYLQLPASNMYVIITIRYDGIINLGRHSNLSRNINLSKSERHVRWEYLIQNIF